MKANQIKKLVYSGVFLALCLVLPFFTGQIPQIGGALLPMHLPVLLCGFVCGWPYGLAIGVIAPLLRSLLFGMPPMFPTALAMACELAGYGFFTGLLYRRFPKKVPFLYVNLVISMLAGRVLWGAARLIFAGVAGSEFAFAAFIAGAFTSAIPGIVVQLILIPILVMALQRTNFMLNTDPVPVQAAP